MPRVNSMKSLAAAATVFVTSATAQPFQATQSATVVKEAWIIVYTPQGGNNAPATIANLMFSTKASCDAAAKAVATPLDSDTVCIKATNLIVP